MTERLAYWAFGFVLSGAMTAAIGKSLIADHGRRIIPVLCGVAVRASATNIAMLTMHRGRVLCVGCSGDVFGYLPTNRQVIEGGYEAGEFLEYFGLSGRFRPNPDALWRELTQELIPHVVRPPAIDARDEKTSRRAHEF